MLNVNLPTRIETRLVELASRTGKTTDAITQAALNIYLEELEDYLDVVEVKTQGAKLKIRPALPRKTLAALLAATPDGLHRAEGWDEMPAAGAER